MISLRSLALVAFAPLALAACGNGSTVVIELTDAPIDTSSIDKVEVSLGKVEIQAGHSCHNSDMKGGEPGAKGGEWIAINDSVGTIDLLSLQNGATLPLGEVELWGEVTSIRVSIDSAGKNQVVLNDGRACAIDTAGITEAQVSIGEGVDAVDHSRGGRTKIVVDFVVEESLTEVSSCNFKLTPVLDIKSITHEDDS